MIKKKYIRRYKIHSQQKGQHSLHKRADYLSSNVYEYVISYLPNFHIIWLIKTWIYVCRSLLEKQRTSTHINSCSEKHMSDKLILHMLIFYASWLSRIKQMILHVIQVCSLTTSPQVVALDWVFTVSLWVPNYILWTIMSSVWLLYSYFVIQ